MSPSKQSRRSAPRSRASQSGVAAYEFALLSAIFFTFVFGIIEVARLAYVFNTLQESTRRAAVAAVNVDPNDSAAIAKIKQNAVFRTSPGELTLGRPVTDNHIRIDYRALVRASDGSLSMVDVPPTSWPTCPGQNRQRCMADPNAANCIRFVRVRVCDPADAGACDAVKSQPIAALVNLSVDLPKATTIVPAESLGFMPGMSLGP